MRLIKINEQGVSLTSRFYSSIPPYAILSHTWGNDEDEVTFDDMRNGRGREKPGFAKIQFCAEQAKRAGIDYCWIDTCCINKSDFSELTESLHSMFSWYQNSDRCFVYLSDFQRTQGIISCTVEDLGKCRWFSRGWTLQELIAPRSVEFFSRDHVFLGSKGQLSFILHKITGIPERVLLDAHTLDLHGSNERISWNNNRQTRRPEDMAYCLFGLLNVRIEVMYGEGETEAVRRLRRYILLEGRDRLLIPGQQLQSPNGQYHFTLKPDGNLVLSGPHGSVWDSHTAGKGVRHAILQHDGNLVLYGMNDAPVWASETPGNFNTSLLVRDSGDVVISSDGGYTNIWSTRTDVGGGSSLMPGQHLIQGRFLQSPNSQYIFILQLDGNLVLYGQNGALWTSNTNGKAVKNVVMQHDGNLAIYSTNSTCIWSSKTNGHPDTRLVVRDRGDAIISCGGSDKTIWSTNTAATTLEVGHSLVPDHHYSSPNGQYHFILQLDGNLVLYGPPGALWASDTDGMEVRRVTIQPDGNLVIYGPNDHPLWASHTQHHPDAKLLIRDRGEVVIISDNKAIWSTNTAETTLEPGQTLIQGQHFKSPNGQYRFTLQYDGNLVLYGRQGALWSSNIDTSRQAVREVVMQRDGNLVIYSINDIPLWASNTQLNPDAKLLIRDRGDVIISSGHRTLWSTGQDCS